MRTTKMINYKETQTITKVANEIPMRRAMLRAFTIFAEEYIKQGRKPLSRSEGGIIYKGDYSNFANLRYFGLIMHPAKNSKWSLTQKGGLFLQGKEPILNPIIQMDGELLPQNHPAWATQNPKAREMYITEFFPGGWKEYEEWKDDMLRTLNS